jgi:two-component system OmpR family sensor kinase
MDLLTKWNQRVREEALLLAPAGGMPEMVQHLVQDVLAIWWSCDRTLPAFNVTYLPGEQARHEKQLEKLANGLIVELKRLPAEPAQRQAWHDAAMDQVERLDRLVDSILASVRIVPAEAAEVFPTDVEATIAEVVNSIRPIVRQHHLDVRPGLRHHALADGPRLRQILEHLIENAVKYAPPETTITIDHALVEGVVRIGVTDQGPGVPEEWRERIFEPYARRETHTARGSGIGLYAAKRLSESMGARLWVEPADPTGARFVVALPAVAAV